MTDWAAPLQGKRVVVTGAGGFIGGRLVERLVRECGATVTVLLRRPPVVRRLAPILESLNTSFGDTRDGKCVADAASGCSVVFHCAYDGTDRQANIHGAQNVVNACLRTGARLVHVSTVAIYLPRADGPLDESAALSDRCSVYASTKIEVDRVIDAAVREADLDAVTIMPTVVYGPHGGTWTTGPAKQLLSGTVVLPEDGGGTCNQVYVDDVCQALIRAAQVEGRSGRRYLISGSSTVTWRAFFEALAEALDCGGPHYITPSELKAPLNEPCERTPVPAGTASIRRLALAIGGRVGARSKARIRGAYRQLRRFTGAPAPSIGATEIDFYRSKVLVSSALAQRELGYRPAYDFEQGMAITGAWLRHELLGR